MRKNLIILFLINSLFILTLLLFGLNIFLINFEIAMLIASFIVVANFKGYQILVERSVGNDLGNYRDTIEKIEDPHDLYDDSDSIDNDEKLELNKIKTEHMKNMVQTKAGFLSKGRLLGYILLVGSLFALKNNAVFHVPGYLLGLFAGIALTAWLATSKKSTAL